jgi:hypothetical protein
LKKFIHTIWKFHRDNRRDMAWRDQPTPYYVVVSEIMLQQTQVHRVIRGAAHTGRRQEEDTAEHHLLAESDDQEDDREHQRDQEQDRDDRGTDQTARRPDR